MAAGRGRGGGKGKASAAVAGAAKTTMPADATASRCSICKILGLITYQSRAHNAAACPLNPRWQAAPDACTAAAAAARVFDPFHGCGTADELSQSAGSRAVIVYPMAPPPATATSTAMAVP